MIVKQLNHKAKRNHEPGSVKARWVGQKPGTMRIDLEQVQLVLAFAVKSGAHPTPTHPLGLGCPGMG